MKRRRTGEASASAVPRPSRAAGAKRGKKVVVRIQAKQSGVKGVSWDDVRKCWQAQWCEGGKRKFKTFYVHKYMKSSGKPYEKADADALRGAIAFRDRLIKDGVIRTNSRPQAGVRGVKWEHGAWRAEIKVEGKKFSGGCFRPKDTTPKEMERARLAAVESRRQLELEHFQIQTTEATDPRAMQKKESGVTGVNWDFHALAWRSYICVKGQRVGKIFSPKDLSDESVEAARLEAVQHRRDLEHRSRDTSKASSSAVPQPVPTDAALAAKGSKQGKRAVRVQAKQRGAKVGGKMKRKRSPVHEDMEPSGMDHQEEDVEALREAIAFRDSLIKETAAEAASAKGQAGKRGVFWYRGAWQVQIRVEGKDLYGGRFRPRDDTPEEIEIARLAAVECRRQLELPHFQIQTRGAAGPTEMQKQREDVDLSGLHQKRDSGVTGVTWDIHGLAWRSYICVKGQRIGKAFMPQDMSDESVEAARLEAVEYRRDLERHSRDTSKASR